MTNLFGSQTRKNVSIDRSFLRARDADGTDEEMQAVAEEGGHACRRKSQQSEAAQFDGMPPITCTAIASPGCVDFCASSAGVAAELGRTDHSSLRIISCLGCGSCPGVPESLEAGNSECRATNCTEHFTKLLAETEMHVGFADLKPSCQTTVRRLIPPAASRRTSSPAIPAITSRGSVRTAQSGYQGNCLIHRSTTGYRFQSFGTCRITIE